MLFSRKNLFLYLKQTNIWDIFSFYLRYSFDDPQFVRLSKIHKQVSDCGPQMAVIQFVPLLGLLYLPLLRNFIRSIKDLSNILGEEFIYHKKTYDEDVTRDFMDALMASKSEAIIKEKSSAKYLSNRVNIITNF